MSYHTNITGVSRPLVRARDALDRQSVVSGCSVRPSVASSIMLHAFNGKKAKVIQTLRNVDELKSGVVKTVIFQNLLSCLDVEIDQDDLADCQRKFGLTYQNSNYIKYELVLRLMQYDNHSEKWVIRKPGADDGDTLSVIAERAKQRVGLRDTLKTRGASIR